MTHTELIAEVDRIIKSASELDGNQQTAVWRYLCIELLSRAGHSATTIQQITEQFAQLKTR